MSVALKGGTKILENGLEDPWIQPAAGDAGCAVGAAYETYFRKFKHNTKLQKIKIGYHARHISWSQYTNDEIHKKRQIWCNF